MMRQINIHEAKTQLSRLIDEVANGEEIIIARAGTPVARLVGLAAPGLPRRPGLLRGKIQIAPDFDAPLPEEILATFEGREP
jgi:prevent-host-death family protein